MRSRPLALTFAFLAALGAETRASASSAPGPAGTLRVAGQASASQDPAVRVQRCATGADGKLLRFGCRTVLEAALNEDVALEPGRYRAEFSGTFSPLVEVRTGERRVLPLERIRIPGGGSGSARIFHDLNDARERAWFLENVLTHADNAELFEADCQEGLPAPFSEGLTRRACDAVRSGRAEELAGTVIRFHPDASWSALGYDGELFGHGVGASYENQGRLWINERRADSGAALSVFPGVYGIELTSPEGSVTERYGLLVRESSG